MKRIINNRKEIIHAEVVVFFICFMLFIFAPFEIYMSSKESFFFEGYEMIGFFALAFIASGVAGTIVNMLCGMLGKRIHQIFFSMALSLGVALYIQGNYVLTNYGALDGNAIEWKNYRVEGLISNGLFVLLIVLGLLLIKKIDVKRYYKAGCGIAVCIVLIQVVTLTTLFFQSGGLGKEPVYVSTTKGEFDYSANENMFVILMDTFDSRALCELLDSEAGEECRTVLENFIFYPDAASVYSNTKFSVPNIISGVKVAEGMTYDKYVEAAFGKNDFYRTLDKSGWDCRVYTDVQLPEASTDMVFDNIEKYVLTVNSHRRLGTYMLKLVGFRYAPQCLKEQFWFYSDDMNSMMYIESEENYKIYNWGNVDFFEGIDKINTDNEQNVFCFYHLEGTHVPHHMNRDLCIVDEEVGINEEGMAMMTILERFFSKLKENEIYNKSTIVILADHGYYDYRNNPIFLVKGINEEHEFAISENRVTFDDMQAIYANLVTGLPAEEAVIESENDERLFYDIENEELREMKVIGNSAETEEVLYTNNILYVD